MNRKLKSFGLVGSILMVLCLLIGKHASSQVNPDYFTEAFSNKTWNKRALTNKGDAGRIAAAMVKASKGAPVTIGVIGGSITAGANSSDFGKTAYGPLVLNWFKKKFPNSTIRFVNAGIGATNSVYGVHRVDTDLLKSSPDLVIVEFSVNDRHEANATESYEGLIRKIRSSALQPGILTLALMDDKGFNWQDYHLPVAKRYKLPMLSYRDAIWPEVTGNTFTWRDLSPDDVHPNDRGHAYIAGLVCNYLVGVYNNMEKLSRPEYDQISKLTFNGYEHSKVLDLEKIKPDAVTAWKPENGEYKATSKGDPLTFTVDGGYISILFTKTNQSTGGKGYVLVDGIRTDLDADFTGGWGVYYQGITLLKSKEKKKHTLSFHFDDERPGKELIINKIMIANY